jgi:hypothetical protein
MKKLIAMLAATMLFATPVFAEKKGDPLSSDTATYAKPGETTTVTPPTVAINPSGPVTTTSTTIVQGGDILSQVIEWAKVVFGGLAATAFVAAVFKGLGYLGVVTTDAMKAQLTAIAVNGINDAAAKAESRVGGKFSIDVKNQVMADAVKYTQDHGAPLIKSLGLDPQSGEAVRAIQARIQTAIIDPMTPTNPALNPENVEPPPVLVVSSRKKG